MTAVKTTTAQANDEIKSRCTSRIPNTTSYSVSALFYISWEGRDFSSLLRFFFSPHMKSTYLHFISILELNTVYIFIARTNSIKIWIIALIGNEEGWGGKTR